MKLKIIIVIIAALIFAALLASNIYDWYKQDNFKAEHNKEKVK